MAEASTLSPDGHLRFGAFPHPSLNPMHWLGDAASHAADGAWKAAMVGLWSCGLWLLQMAFKIIDSFTTPDLSADGPMKSVLPTTLWIGGAVAVLMMFVQLCVALIRRDGASIGRIFLGIGQFALVWAGYLGVAGVLVTAASGLEHGILAAMLNVHSLADVDLAKKWPRQLTDATTATVLGVSSLLLLVPASFFYLLIMLVREAALIILVATAPISAAGLVADASKTWFWKTLRWLISCLLIAPLVALVLGIGIQLANGVITGHGDKTTQAIGTAVIGAVLVMIGAVCPLVLFRLLAFVEPGTASGAALRQSWSDAGGMSGLMSGQSGTESSGSSSAATQSSTDGRSAGESSAETSTQSRTSSVMGSLSAGMGALTSLASRAADVGSDVLGSAGVGHPGYAMTPTDERSSRRSQSSNSSQSNDSAAGGGSGDQPPGSDSGGGGGPAGPGGGGGPSTSGPGTQPDLAGTSSGGSPQVVPAGANPTQPNTPKGGGGGSAPPAAGGGAAGAGGGAAEAAAVVAL